MYVLGGVLSGSEGNGRALTSGRIYLRVSRLSERRGFVLESGVEGEQRDVETAR